MLKRLFDLMIATVMLLITLPIILLVALAIRLDSPGPVLYRSPRLGRHGKPIGMWRFRTVDLQRAPTLPMKERLTRVGRFIRDYSLDDFPNLFNILLGDLSCIGPRPMEPERVDSSDPRWREILTVRPGMLGGPAILQLGKHYNSSPDSIKQQLEVAYVRKQSFRLDLQLFGRVLRQLLVTHGNLKRGEPQSTLSESRKEP